MKSKPTEPAHVFQDHSCLPDYLSAAQRQHVDMILRQSQIVLVSCLFWRMNIRDLFPRRKLSDSFLYAPVKGAIRCRVGAERATVGPGQFIFVSEGVEHEAEQAPGHDLFEAFAIHVHAHTNGGVPLYSLFPSAVGVARPTGHWFEQFRLLTHLMGTEPELGRRLGPELIRSLLARQILEGRSLTQVPRADDPRPWSAVYQMLNAFPRTLAVRDLARGAGISEVQFRKVFCAQMGKSPKEYMMQMRLDKARALLRSDPRLTVKQVAERTGFGDPHILHAAFKRAYGLTPAACREAEPAPNEG